jgi:hypothetical protein
MMPEWNKLAEKNVAVFIYSTNLKDIQIFTNQQILKKPHDQY